MHIELRGCKTINMPRVSVIVPCHNRSKTIALCLAAIQASVYKDYEIIVVDDHSNDDTAAIARGFTDRVITLSDNKGSGNARRTGIENSTSSILCFIDSDIIIKPGTLSTIVDFLDGHADVDAVTGLLSKEHPNRDLFSQYKNLYMNYTFSLLPQRVTFIFGSIYAMRRKTGHTDQGDLRYAPDTEYGQKLIGQGRIIAFLKDLEVVHLKEYTFLSLIKNDFLVPFSWGKIFIRFQGWQQLGKNKTGFAHAPSKQLVGVIIAPLLGVLAAAGHFFPIANASALILLALWLTLNAGFFFFLLKERGILFLLAGVVITFIDQIVMALGITAGFCSELFN